MNSVLLFQFCGELIDAASALLNIRTAALEGGDNMCSWDVILRSRVVQCRGESYRMRVSVPIMPRRKSAPRISAAKNIISTRNVCCFIRVVVRAIGTVAGPANLFHIWFDR